MTLLLLQSGPGSSAAAAGGGGDPYWSSVVLLMGFNDVNNATGSPGMTDESGAAHGTGTVSNQAKISTAQSKFGGSSLLCDGTADVVKFADHADWHLSNQPFTIECWIRLATVASGTRFIVCQWESGPNLGWNVYNDTANLRLNLSTSGSDSIVVATGGAMSANTWHAVCVDFSGSKYRLYIDGTMVASSTTPRTVPNVTMQLSIGASGGTNSFGFNGYIDELRITKGVARYASDSGYTVATSAFPRS